MFLSIKNGPKTEFLYFCPRTFQKMTKNPNAKFWTAFLSRFSKNVWPKNNEISFLCQFLFLKKIKKIFQNPNVSDFLGIKSEMNL